MKKYELEKMSVEDYGQVKMLVEQIDEAISNYFDGESCDVREWKRFLDEKFWDVGHEANYILHEIDNVNGNFDYLPVNADACGNSVVFVLDDMRKHLNEIRDFTMVRDARTRIGTKRYDFLENAGKQLGKISSDVYLLGKIIDRHLLELAE